MVSSPEMELVSDLKHGLKEYPHVVGVLLAGPDTIPLSQLSLSGCVPATTQLTPLIHSAMVEIS